MRDLILLAVFPAMLYAMVQRPFIGLGMWAWTALFFPNGWVYGLAAGIRYNLVFTCVTVLSYLASRDKPKMVVGGLGAAVFLFFTWTTVTSLFGLNHPDIVWEIWSRFAKIIALFWFVLLIMDKKLHFDFFLWCVILSVGFYASVEALKYAASGGGHKIAGIHGHILADRNELAIAFVMTMPLCLYLLREYGSTSKIVKLGLLGCLMCLVLATIGTNSRGGFIALLVFGGYLFLKADRKGLIAALTGVVVFILSFLVSDEWIDRMNTIQEADEDASFMGRVVAWKLSFILAMRSPFVGGGFRGLEYFPVWKSLSEEFHSYAFFYTGDALPETERARAAHSVYFQVLGDHGWVGLAMFLVMLVLGYMTAAKTAKQARAANAPAWIAQLATMFQLSIFSFCLGAAALSFAYFDLLYAILGMVVVLKHRILPRYL